MTGTVLALILQLNVMTGLDSYYYTFPNLHPPYGEANPIAAGLGQAYPPLAGIAEIGGAVLVDDFDQAHFKGWPIQPGDLILSGLIVMEINAIHSWAKDGYGGPERKWTIFRLDF